MNKETGKKLVNEESKFPFSTSDIEKWVPTYGDSKDKFKELPLNVPKDSHLKGLRIRHSRSSRKKDLIIIGTKVLGMGQKYEIPCKDVKDFKILDENSKTLRSTSGLKKAGGAVVGGILTGGIGAIVGAMISGNKKTKNLKVNLGFKLKNKDWFIASISTENKESLTGGLTEGILKAIVKRFAEKTEAPF